MPKVLVVDDSLSVRKVVERALAARSIQVLSASSGDEAIEAIERETPDVVICDVIMPDKDGYAICEFVKGHPALHKTPVLLISGIVNGTVLERAAQVQSDDVMRKPFAAEELVRKIDGFLTVAGNGALPGPSALPRSAEPAPGSTAPAASTVHDPFQEANPPAAPPDLKTSLAQFAGMPGVVLAGLVDREGFLIESAGDLGIETEVAWAWASCLAEASDGIGGELGQGTLHAMILEYEGGVILLNAMGPAALLAIVLRDPTALGKVRYSVKRALPELLRAM